MLDPSPVPLPPPSGKNGSNTRCSDTLRDAAAGQLHLPRATCSRLHVLVACRCRWCPRTAFRFQRSACRHSASHREHDFEIDQCRGQLALDRPSPARFLLPGAIRYRSARRALGARAFPTPPSARSRRSRAAGDGCFLANAGAPGQLGATISGLTDQFSDGCKLRLLPHGVCQDVDRAGDDRGLLCEVVRHTTGRLPNRLHFSLPPLIIDLTALTDVFHSTENVLRHALLVVDSETCDVTRRVLLSG